MSSLRVWIMPEGVLRFYDVPDVTVAIWLLIGLTRAGKSQSWVGAEVYGMETFSKGEWIEWLDEEGNDIIFHMEKVIDLIKAGKYDSVEGELNEIQRIV